MRCPAKGGPPRVLYQVPFLLLWILHSASCLERSVTSWRPGTSITTVEPTSTTGPGTSIGKLPSGPQQTLTVTPVSLDDVTSSPVGDVAAASRTAPPESGLWVSPTTSRGYHGNQGGQQADSRTRDAGGLATPYGSDHWSVTPTDQVNPTPWSLQSVPPSQPPPPSSSPLYSEPSPRPELHSSSSSSPSSSSVIQPSAIYSDPLLLPSSEFPDLSSTSDAAWSSRTRTPSLDVTEQLVTSQQYTSGAVPDATPSHTLLTSATSDVITNMSETSSVTSSVTSSSTRAPSVSPWSSFQPTPSVLHVDMNATSDSKIFTDATPSGEMWNQTSVLPPGDDKEGLSVGATVGISVACVLVVVSGVLVGLAILYHRHKSRKLDTTKAPNNHYTGLWDDNITLSYINNHFDFFQKDAQDEMISLDNDAYLNSLEFMVFTNTWGDGKRNTRF